MHDQGPLPPPKEEGDMALLIGCVNDAKKFSDKLLTEVIMDETATRAASGKEHVDKKAKTHKNGS